MLDVLVVLVSVMFGPMCSLFAENHVFSDESIPIKGAGSCSKGNSY